MKTLDVGFKRLSFVITHAPLISNWEMCKCHLRFKSEDVWHQVSTEEDEALMRRDVNTS